MILDASQPGSVQSSVQVAAEALARGDLLGMPTETVYGLAADADNDAAVAQIFAAKGRPTNHPLIVHVADADTIRRYAKEVPLFAQQLIDAFWPGPLTVILPRLPQVPTLGELGYRAANINSLFGVFAPAATPAALVAKYNAEINKALASPELRAKLTATDNVPTGGTPAAFAKEIASEFESNGRIVKAAGIKAD